MFKRLAVLGALLALAIADTHQAKAQMGSSSPPGVFSINNCRGICTVVPGSFIGTYTVSTLPACNNTTTPYGSSAYVTDLGGGANVVNCAAGTWQYVSMGIPNTNNIASGTVTITPLVSAPIQIMTGNILTALSVTIATSGLYPGYELCVIRPGLLTGSIAVGVSGTGSTLPVLGSTRACFAWDGTTLQQIQ